MNKIRPLITEKSMILAQGGWYSFVVGKFVRKETIAKEIGALYNVTVTDVRTVARHGKTRRAGRKMVKSQKPDWKKAMVRLKNGQKIPVFDMGSKAQKA